MENKWILESLKIDFKKGYDFDKTVDRYEGVITFRNKDSEKFTFNIKPDETNQFLELISEKVISSAKELGEKITLQILEQV